MVVNDKQNKTTLFGAVHTLGLDPESPEFLKISSAIMLNVLGVSDAYACQKALNNNVDFSKLEMSGQKFRLMLSDIAYIHLNLKFFMLNIIKHTNTGRHLAEFGNQFDVHRNDIVLIKRILSARGLLSDIRKHKRVQEVTKDMITVEAFDRIFDMFTQIHPVISKHIRNKTYQKLRFISISSNVEFYDLNMELMCKAVQAYVKLVPTAKTESHIKAYICRALNNHTVNMINSYTSQKRKRMEKGAKDGYGGYSYEITMLSENQLLRAFGVEGLSYENMQSSENNQEEERLRDSDISYELILKRFGTSPKRKTFIELISILENDGFTEYLQDRDLIAQTEDNVDYKEKISCDLYIKSVCDYLNVSTESAKNFMSKIAKTAYPDKESEFLC